MRLRSAYLLLAAAHFFSCQPEKLSDPGVSVKEGFIVEKLYAPGDHGQGSWVSITKDDKGRLIASDQYGKLYYIDAPPLDSYDSVKVTPIPLEIGSAQGLLWAYGGLYVMVNKKPGDKSGLYRVTDSDGDGVLDSISLLKQLTGWGEHGPHAALLGPDGFIYIVAGNHTDLPETFKSRLKPVWEEDQLFPSIKDPRGHANNRNAPGGWIARVTKDGEDLTVIANGFRNAYDIAFNEDGELFTFDSDMEWDLGTPWYRPVKVCHITPGAEFGWRTGSAKWPPYYLDNLPSVVDLGQGSPTGIVAGKDLEFPAQYRTGLFVFDWSFGTIYHVSLTPKGSSYVGTKEEFLSASALPLTDGVAGGDGALYFLTGGRRLKSHLYRVFYNGPEGDQEPEGVANSPDMELRMKLESFQRDGEADYDLIWTSLAN